MKKIYTFLLLLTAVIFASAPVFADGAASVVTRPTQINLASDTSQSAVLMNLTTYSVDSVRYRLYSGGVYYYCWDADSLKYATTNSYAKGPLALGTPSTSTTFWIVFQRGLNTTAAASYRDRLAPAYSSNNNTVALPAATGIVTPMVLSGKVLAATINDLSVKYVVLAYSGATLVSASSTYLTSGVYNVTCEAGTAIDKIEVRTLTNNTLAELTGSWNATSAIADIQLVDPSASADASLSDISLDGSTMAGFFNNKFSYTYELGIGTTAIPAITYTTTDGAATAVQTDATDLTGDAAARTTTITVTAADGITTQDYVILFNPLLEAATLADFRAGDPSRTYVCTGDLLITYINSNRNQKFIQDASGAVMIDDPSGAITTTYAVGDIITGLKGQLLTYAGLIEFTPAEDPGAPKSSGNEVVPVEVSVADLNANVGLYESKYVKLVKVTPVDAGAVIAAKANYTIGDGVNTTILRTNFSDLDYIGGVMPGLSDISGVTTSYNGTMQIIPRFATDFYIYSTDATLSALSADGTSVPGFAAGTHTYAVTLPAGTSAIPVIAYTAASDKAAAVVTNATDLAGDEAARTSTVAVTAEDGTTMITYTIVFTLHVVSTDASLSDLAINSATVTGFASGTVSYAVLLPVGTSEIPVITYVTSDLNANAVVTNATNLMGTEAERTSTVVVTAEDGSTIVTYTLVFTVDNTGIKNNAPARISVYPVPATDQITVSGLANAQKLEVMDVTGKVLRKVEITSDEITINISNLRKGMYFLRTESHTMKFIKK